MNLTNFRFETDADGIALVTLCIGGGMGTATIIERV